MAFKFQAQKAVREKVDTKIMLFSPSGAGKTYSALRLATGMASEISKNEGRPARILFGNTEASRGYYYADEFTYDIVDLIPPYNPEMFVDFINYAVAEKYDILIIDSISPEWEGKGGCLELQQQAGGRYTDWAKISPRHDKFIQAIINAPIHIINTARAKSAYETSKDDRGKVTPTKIGLDAKQREGMDFEHTCVFQIDTATHMATVQKDNTHIWDLEPTTLLTEELGVKIIKWASSGEAKNVRDYVAQPATSSTENTDPTGTVTDNELINDKITETKSLIESLVGSGVDKTAIAEVIKTYHKVNGRASANYQTIKDVDVFDSVIAGLKNLVK